MAVVHFDRPARSSSTAITVPCIPARFLLASGALALPPPWHFGPMTDELSLAAEFPPATREDWLKLVRSALKDRPFERLIAKTYDGIPIEPLYGRAADARPVAGAPRPLAGDGAGRSSRSGRRQRRGAARTGERRDRADAGLRRLGRRLWLRPAGRRRIDRARARGRASRRHRDRAADRRADQGRRRPCRRAGEEPRPRARRGQHPLRPRRHRRAHADRHAAHSLPRSDAALCRACRLAGQGRASRARSPPPTAASSTTPAARRRRSWPTRSRSRSLTCARSKAPASRSMPRAA